MNSAFEKQTGYQASDVVGTEIQERLQVDNCNEEETLVYHMKKHQVNTLVCRVCTTEIILYQKQWELQNIIIIIII